jgi:hypothetical protein
MDISLPGGFCSPFYGKVSASQALRAFPGGGRKKP